MVKRRFRHINGQVVEVTAAPRGANDWKQLVSENMGWDGTLESAQAEDRAAGAPHVDYVRVGPNAYNPVFNDKRTYNRYLKAHGYFNKTSGKGNHALDGNMLARLMERMRGTDE